MEQFFELLKEKKVIAILRVKSLEEALEKGKVIFESGVSLLEVTFTVPNAAKAIHILKRNCPGAVVGAGTVINAKMCEEALCSGAEFVISPNFDEDVSRICNENRVPYIPGVMTPTEIVRAYSFGNRVLKLFPGEVLGPIFVKAMKGPFPDVDFVATGGVSVENIRDWFKAGVIGVGMGGSLVNGSIEEIQQKVRKILSELKGSY